MLLFSAVKCAIFALTWTKTTNEANLNGQNLCYRANMFCFSEWISFVFSSASIQHIWESTTRLSPMRSPHCKQLKETLTSLFSFFSQSEEITKIQQKRTINCWTTTEAGPMVACAHCPSSRSTCCHVSLPLTHKSALFVCLWSVVVRLSSHVAFVSIFGNPKKISSFILLFHFCFNVYETHYVLLQINFRICIN